MPLPAKDPATGSQPCTLSGFHVSSDHPEHTQPLQNLSGHLGKDNDTYTSGLCTDSLSERKSGRRGRTGPDGPDKLWRQPPGSRVDVQLPNHRGPAGRGRGFMCSEKQTPRRRDARAEPAFRREGHLLTPVSQDGRVTPPGRPRAPDRGLALGEGRLRAGEAGPSARKILRGRLCA